MKATRTRTLRGVIDIASGTSGKAQLIVDDGIINRGYKVTGFFVWSNIGDTAFNANLAFASQTIGGSKMDAGDNSQFAWAWLAGGTGVNAPNQFIIDPDHIAVRDMFITIEDAGSAVPFNYMIVVEEYAMTDDEAIINIIKEGSQSL
jgi:hypothetical protein